MRLERTVVQVIIQQSCDEDPTSRSAVAEPEDPMNLPAVAARNETNGDSVGSDPEEDRASTATRSTKTAYTRPGSACSASYASELDEYISRPRINHGKYLQMMQLQLTIAESESTELQLAIGGTSRRSHGLNIET